MLLEILGVMWAIVGIAQLTAAAFLIDSERIASRLDSPSLRSWTVLRFASAVPGLVFYLWYKSENIHKVKAKQGGNRNRRGKRRSKRGRRR